MVDGGKGNNALSDRSDVTLKRYNGGIIEAFVEKRSNLWWDGAILSCKAGILY